MVIDVTGMERQIFQMQDKYIKNVVYKILVLADIGSNKKAKGRKVWLLRKQLWDKYVGSFDLTVGICDLIRWKFIYYFVFPHFLLL